MLPLGALYGFLNPDPAPDLLEELEEGEEEEADVELEPLQQTTAA